MGREGELGVVVRHGLVELPAHLHEVLAGRVVLLGPIPFLQGLQLGVKPLRDLVELGEHRGLTLGLDILRRYDVLLVLRGVRGPPGLHPADLGHRPGLHSRQSLLLLCGLGRGGQRLDGGLDGRPRQRGLGRRGRPPRLLRDLHQLHLPWLWGLGLLRRRLLRRRLRGGPTVLLAAFLALVVLVGNSSEIEHPPGPLLELLFCLGDEILVVRCQVLGHLLAVLAVLPVDGPHQQPLLLLPVALLLERLGNLGPLLPHEFQNLRSLGVRLPGDTGDLRLAQDVIQIAPHGRGRPCLGFLGLASLLGHLPVTRLFRLARFPPLHGLLPRLGIVPLLLLRATRLTLRHRLVQELLQRLLRVLLRRRHPRLGT